MNTPSRSPIIRDFQESLTHARHIIESGGVIAFRTDTLYGLGADPFNERAVAFINQLKGREGGKPILVIISDTEESERFIAHKNELFDTLAKHHWPGALTIVAAARASVSEQLTAGSGTIGVRLPHDEEVRALVRAGGGALTATSANPAGEQPARTAVEVAAYFPTELDLIVDGGSARTEKPSTVIDVSHGTARLIREGEISRQALQKSLQTIGHIINEE